MHHFGAPLVRTPSDFGLRSEPPTHPELLDYLARWFMDNGWSTKKLHRLIMLSNAYQQSSVADEAAMRNDPENRLLSRMNRRRLDFESLRDALLVAGGDLDVTVGGPAVNLSAEPFSRRRTVYGQIERQNLPGMFRTFDFASPDAHSPQRFTTTIPQQALFLLNSPFAVEQAKRLAARDEIVNAPNAAERVGRMIALVYGRPAAPNEISLAEQFIAGAQSASDDHLTPWDRFAHALLMANEFVYID
jgi:hypothetical protein